MILKFGGNLTCWKSHNHVADRSLTLATSRVQLYDFDESVTC